MCMVTSSCSLRCERRDSNRRKQTRKAAADNDNLSDCINCNGNNTWSHSYLHYKGYTCNYYHAVVYREVKKQLTKHEIMQQQ